VLALLALAFFNPQWSWRQTPIDVVILLDDSLSMDRNFDAGSVWRQMAAELAALPPDSRFALVRFAADSVLEIPLTPAAAVPAAPPKTQSLDRSASRIENALLFGLRLLEPGRTGVLALLSDGRETDGQAAAALRLATAAGALVYGSAPTLATQVDDAWIEALDLPGRGRLGQRLPATVILASAFDGDGRLQLWVNGHAQVETPVSLRRETPTVATYWLEPTAVGPNRVEVELEAAGDRVAENNTRAAVVNVAGLATVSYLTVEPVAPSAALSLQHGGWPIQVLLPGAFPQHGWPDSAVIILDNIAIDDLSESAWEQLAQKVREQGAGLIVLGGSRSFGGGGYRHSLLESLLPVTAEAARPQPPAAVLFVVDKSGSMEQSEGGFSRLALARRAVVETARTLLAGDPIGLLAFDGQPHWLLPLDHHIDPVRVLEQAWQIRAAGGTRLRPALREALARLETIPVEQRLLVLVTDGFVEGEAFADLEQQVADAGITVIALAVGETADLRPLQRLARHHGGRVLSVRDVATLPRLLPKTVVEHRMALQTGLSQPQLVQPLPYPLAADWPPLDAYRVTRARPEASVYLRSEQGDPLLAGWRVGAGWVLALPGGLGAWATAWQRWSDWGSLLGGLVEWANGYSDSSVLDLQVQDQPGALKIVLDGLAEDRDWEVEGTATLALRDPHGRLQNLTPVLVAPGRYVAETPVSQPGPYRITAQIGSHRIQHELLHAPATELTAAGRYDDWQQQMLLRPWPEQGLRAAMTTRQPIGLQNILLVVAVTVYIVLLLVERRWPDRWAWRLIRRSSLLKLRNS
jgi:hypothetical protein